MHVECFVITVIFASYVVKEHRFILILHPEKLRHEEANQVTEGHPKEKADFLFIHEVFFENLLCSWHLVATS